MKIVISRENLLKAIQAVIGVVEKRHSMPILANLLLQVQNNTLTITASDLEIETRSQIELENSDGNFTTTLPALKLSSIIKSLPEGLTVEMMFKDNRCQLAAGRSHFKLSTLSADDFPTINFDQIISTFTLEQQQLKSLIHNTAFSMANQDVRFYLNGMLFDINSDTLRLVATDGHRLSTSVVKLSVNNIPAAQLIVPRKGINELQKITHENDNLVELSIAKNYLTVKADTTIFTCKLIDGRFPDYTKVIPSKHSEKLITQKELLKSIFQRSVILSNEKIAGVRLVLSKNLITVETSNPENDESHEDMVVNYDGPDMEIGFNAEYMIDVLSSYHKEEVILKFKDTNSSCLIEHSNSLTQHVIMPMRL